MFVWAVNIGLAVFVLVLAIRAPQKDKYLRADFTTGPRWRRASALLLFYGVLTPIVWFTLRAFVGVALPPY